MPEQKLKQGQKIFFTNEKLPFEVKAVSERYAVITRKLHRREDAELLHQRVSMSAYCSFTEAFEDNKDAPIYSIIDFDKNIKAPHFFILNPYDFKTVDGAKACLDDLETGQCELSRRNKVELSIDWERTFSGKK